MLKQLLRLVIHKNNGVRIAAIALLVLLSSLAIFAQEPTEPVDTTLYSTRLVCIEATGCLYVVVDESTIHAISTGEWSQMEITCAYASLSYGVRREAE